MFRIVCCAGIGDTAQNLCLFPHEFLYRKFGFRSGVVFMQLPMVEGDSANGPMLAHAEPPDLKFFKNLVDRCPSLIWRGEVSLKKNFGIALNRLLREGLKAANQGQPPYFPFSPTLTREESTVLPERGEGPLIGLQTHLTGMKTKRWGIENWSRFLELLLKARPDLRIVLFETASPAKELVLSPRITTTLGFTLAQSICVIPRLDLLVSVDSWTKYIAKAHRIPQIIIVPDVTPEYPHMQAELLMAKHFPGLCADPEIKLIGLQPHPPALTLPRLTDLRPEDLLPEVLSKLQKSLKEDPLAGRSS